MEFISQIEAADGANYTAILKINDRVRDYRVHCYIAFGCFIFSCSEFKLKQVNAQFNDIHQSVKFIVNQDFHKLKLENKIKRLKMVPNKDYFYGSDYIYIRGMKVAWSDQFVQGQWYAKDERDLFKQYKELALDHFVSLVNKWKKIMNIDFDVEVSMLPINSISKLGVNLVSKKALKFHPQLFSFKDEAQESVIIHELAHFYQANHSKAFYAIVLKYCPAYYELTKALTRGDFEYGFNYNI